MRTYCAFDIENAFRSAQVGTTRNILRPYLHFVQTLLKKTGYSKLSGDLLALPEDITLMRPSHLILREKGLNSG